LGQISIAVLILTVLRHLVPGAKKRGVKRAEQQITSDKKKNQ
jgi:hypothetical protein